MSDRFLEAVVKECLIRECSEAEASLQTGVSLRAGLELGTPIKEYVNHVHLGVRVSMNGRLGSAIISTVEGLSAEAVAEIAIRSALANPIRHGLPRAFAVNQILPHNDARAGRGETSLNEASEWIETEAEAVRQAFRCQLLSLMFGYERWQFALCNSNEVHGCYTSALSHVAGFAQSSSTGHVHPTFFLCHRIMPGDSINSALSDNDFAERLWYNSAKSVEDLKGRIKFSPMASAQFISLITHAFSGDNILHKKSFLRKEQIGKPLWSKSISLIDDPVVVEGNLCLPFDAEGIPGERKYLVSKGAMVGALCDIAAQARLGHGKPGNSRRMPPDHTIRIAPSNLIMEIDGDQAEDYDVYIGDLGAQSMVDLATGVLSGMATGYRLRIDEKIPVMFPLGLHVGQMLANVFPASEPVWIGSVCAPAFVTVIG